MTFRRSPLSTWSFLTHSEIHKGLGLKIPSQPQPDICSQRWTGVGLWKPSVFASSSGSHWHIILPWSSLRDQVEAEYLQDISTLAQLLPLFCPATWRLLTVLRWVDHWCINPHLRRPHRSCLTEESTVLHPHKVFEVAIPFYRCRNGGSGGPPDFQMFTQLEGNSSWPPASSCFVLRASKSFIFVSWVLKNKRKPRGKDLMRHLVSRGRGQLEVGQKAVNLITKPGSSCFWNHIAERFSDSSTKSLGGNLRAIVFLKQGTLQPAGCWHWLASCLNRLLKSRRNIKACKLVPAISSKNFNWSWEVIGASLGVIKIDS